MQRTRKLELIQRTLGLRHKLKVHESMEAPTTHEDLSLMLMAKWELEDELRAIEEILTVERDRSVDEKKTLIEKGILGKNKAKGRMEEVRRTKIKSKKAGGTPKKASSKSSTNGASKSR